MEEYGLFNSPSLLTNVSTSSDEQTYDLRKDIQKVYQAPQEQVNPNRKLFGRGTPDKLREDFHNFLLKLKRPLVASTPIGDCPQSTDNNFRLTLSPIKVQNNSILTPLRNCNNLNHSGRITKPVDNNTIKIVTRHLKKFKSRKKKRKHRVVASKKKGVAKRSVALAPVALFQQNSIDKAQPENETVSKSVVCSTEQVLPEKETQTTDSLLRKKHVNQIPEVNEQHSNVHVTAMSPPSQPSIICLSSTLDATDVDVPPGAILINKESSAGEMEACNTPIAHNSTPNAECKTQNGHNMSNLSSNQHIVNNINTRNEISLSNTLYTQDIQTCRFLRSQSKLLHSISQSQNVNVTKHNLGEPKPKVPKPNKINVTVTRDKTADSKDVATDITIQHTSNKKTRKNINCIRRQTRQNKVLRDQSKTPKTNNTEHSESLAKVVTSIEQVTINHAMSCENIEAPELQNTNIDNGFSQIKNHVGSLNDAKVITGVNEIEVCEANKQNQSQEEPAECKKLEKQVKPKKRITRKVQLSPKKTPQSRSTQKVETKPIILQQYIIDKKAGLVEVKENSSEETQAGNSTMQNCRPKRSIKTPKAFIQATIFGKADLKRMSTNKSLMKTKLSQKMRDSNDNTKEKEVSRSNTASKNIKVMTNSIDQDAGASSASQDTQDNFKKPIGRPKKSVYKESRLKSRLAGNNLTTSVPISSPIRKPNSKTFEANVNGRYNVEDVNATENHHGLTNSVLYINSNSITPCGSGMKDSANNKHHNESNIAVSHDVVAPNKCNKGFQKEKCKRSSMISNTDKDQSQNIIHTVINNETISLGWFSHVPKIDTSKHFSISYILTDMKSHMCTTSCGYITFGPGQQRLQTPRKHTIMYKVEKGRGAVTQQLVTRIIEINSCFYIPLGSPYKIKNLSDTEPLILYFNKMTQLG